MRPINPYKDIRHKNPSVDQVPYECNSVEDYLQNKDNAEEFPRGKVFGLCALILGTQKLGVNSSQIRPLAQILTDEGLFIWEPTSLNESLMACEGIVISLCDAYMSKTKSATLFLEKGEYEKLKCPPEGNILVQDSLVAYPPLFAGTQLQGFYVVQDVRKRPPKWNPKVPGDPTKVLERA